MVDRVGYKVEGLSKITRAFKQLGAEVDDLKDAFAAIAREGAERAARHVKSKSGRAASTVRGNRATSKAVVTAGRASVPYLGPINYGWPKRGIEAQGFMQKADEEMRPRALELLEQDINQKIREKGLS
jgi:hypothetical protein